MPRISMSSNSRCTAAAAFTAAAGAWAEATCGCVATGVMGADVTAGIVAFANAGKAEFTSAMLLPIASTCPAPAEPPPPLPLSLRRLLLEDANRCCGDGSTGGTVIVVAIDGDHVCNGCSAACCSCGGCDAGEGIGGRVTTAAEGDRSSDCGKICRWGCNDGHAIDCVKGISGIAPAGTGKATGGTGNGAADTSGDCNCCGGKPCCCDCNGWATSCRGGDCGRGGCPSSARDALPPGGRSEGVA
mmetsp:Transcript_41702/g.104776  ORF Transcript_41702/g.104776 Transcript_41702/m.104776 type:complete len:244 (+) Transcript_41702:700-1431(+)